MDGDGGPLVLEDQSALERIVEFAAEHGIEIAVPIARCSRACTRRVAGRPSPFLLACRAHRNRRRVIHGVLTLLDPSPYAILCNIEQYREQKTPYLCGICNPVQRSATTDCTLVAGAGQRFESARRLSFHP